MILEMFQLSIAVSLLVLIQAQNYPYVQPGQQPYQPYPQPSDVYPFNQPGQNGFYPTTTSSNSENQRTPLEGFLTAFGQLVNAYARSTEEVAKTAPLYSNSVDDQAALINKYVWRGLRDFLNERLPLLEKSTTTTGPSNYIYSNSPNEQQNMG